MTDQHIQYMQYNDEMISDTLSDMIASSFKNAKVEIKSYDTRVLVTIVSNDFDGLTPVERHKLVYKSIGGLPDFVHSLRINALTYCEEQGHQN